MIELRALGGALLTRDGVAVRGRAAQRHHLALLAVLGVSPGATASRDKLIVHFWPESDAAKARHRLSVALHVIRRDLGHDCLITSGDNVTLNAALVWSDTEAFIELVKCGRLGEAVDLYRGPFLDGFFLSGLPDFEQWLDGERARLSDLYRTSLEHSVAEAERTRDHASAARWWKRLAAYEPFSAPTALGVLRCLAAVGDLGGAIRHARAYAARVEGELGLAPDPEVLALADELALRARERSELNRTVRTGVGDSPASGPSAVSVKESRSSRSFRAPRRARATLMAAGGLGMAALVGAWAWLHAEGGPQPGPGEVRSIIVQDFGVEGMAEAIGRNLAERIVETLRYVPGLDVRMPSAPGSVGAAPVSSVARPLEGVPVELRGSLAASADRVLVRAELWDHRTGDSRWAGVYELAAGDEHGLIDAVSLTIAHDVRVALVPYVPKVYTPSRRAYERFLLGVYAMRRNTREDLWQALQFHREAYEEDPSFALAHAIAANAYIALVGRGVAPDVGFEQAREHVLHSLALDDELAEGHAALGYLQIWWDRDFDAGEGSLRRAIMLYPTLPQAHGWYGLYLLYVRNRPEEAVAHVRRALEVDPLNTARSRTVETVLYRARLYEEVERQSMVTWSLDPEIASHLPSPLGHAYREMGRYEESVAEFRALHERVGGTTLAGAAIAYARMGRVNEALTIARDLEALPGGGPPLPLARINANLGDADRAFEWLRVAEERRPETMLQIAADPALDPIRDDPRFAELLERIGIAR